MNKKLVIVVLLFLSMTFVCSLSLIGAFTLTWYRDHNRICGNHSVSIDNSGSIKDAKEGSVVSYNDGEQFRVIMSCSDSQVEVLTSSGLTCLYDLLDSTEKPVCSARRL